ncbi:MAG: hypothetical protein AAGG46_07075, partial [Planctomycetota bacterium]
KKTAWRFAKSEDAEWMLGDPVVFPLSNLTEGGFLMEAKNRRPWPNKNGPQKVVEIWRIRG